MRTVAILGSTGSIGTQALEVIREYPGEFEVVGLAAGGNNLELLQSQAREFNVPPTVRVAGAVDLAGSGADVVLNGITGSIGLRPTLAALAAGSTLALANKESLVAGGALVKAAVQFPGQIVPVDSEHSAIAQSLRGGRAAEVRRIILTASGGPFRGRCRSDLVDITAAQALKHPTWDMGPVVTINSATLVNKGLELIEAHLLFDVPVADIEVVVHPQSQVHSMVEFQDGATIAQVSPPDMKLPIALGLSWPDRLPQVIAPNNWSAPVSWEFLPVDNVTFPAVELARAAVTASATHPVVYNAANEVAVAAFLAGKIGFLSIVDTVSEVISRHDGVAANQVTLEAVETAEHWARTQAQMLLRS